MAPQKFLKYLLLTVIAGNLALVAYVFLGSSPPKPTPMPNPNGYDDFVKAGKMLSGRISGFESMNQAELTALISKNADALKLLREGLSRECRATYDFSRDSMPRMLDELAAEKELAQFLNAEGRLALLNGQTNDAVKIYVEGVQYGIGCGRGGVLIQRLVSGACEALGLRSLRRLMSDESLDARQCAEIARSLEQIDAKEEPITEMLKREQSFNRKVVGIRGQLMQFIHYKNTRAREQKALQKFQTNQVNRRKLMIDFAARAYELEKGKPPATLTDLVPAYLKAIPKDPTTGVDMVYHR